MRPADVSPHLEQVLLGWSAGFRGGHAALPSIEVRSRGAEIEVDVAAAQATRHVRGRLSAFALLAGRFWAAAEQDAEAYRLRGAWVPTLLDASGDRPGIEEVTARHAIGDALRGAAALFDAAGEAEEAALCRERAEPHDASLAAQPLDALLAGFKRGDPVERLRTARACESAIHRLADGDALEALSPFRAPLRSLLADAQPALHERGLALTEAWARRLFARRAYRECLPLLDTLLEANVLVMLSLRMRLEARLALGDLQGARNDRVRLAKIRARAGDLVTAGSDMATEDPDEWYVSALRRVARAHEDWSHGVDPCPDRRTPPRVAPATRRRHAEAARARLREAAEVENVTGRARTS